MASKELYPEKRDRFSRYSFNINSDEMQNSTNSIRELRDIVANNPDTSVALSPSLSSNIMQDTLNPSMTSSSVTPKKRRRPALACTRCRSRKVKCDRNLPCNQCIRMGCTRQCTFTLDERVPEKHPARKNETPHQTPQQQIVLSPPTSISSVGDDQIRDKPAVANDLAVKSRGSIWRRQLFDPYLCHASPIEETGQGVQLDPGSSRSNSSNVDDAPADHFHKITSSMIFSRNKHSDTTQSSRTSETALQAALDKLEQLSTFSKDLQETQDGHGSNANQALIDGVKDLEKKLSGALELERAKKKPLPDHVTSEELPAGWTFEKTRLFAQGHWRSCLEKFCLILRVYHKAEREPDAEVPRLLGQCKQLAREIKRPVDVPVMATSELYTILPPKDIVDRLVTAYLRTFEGVYRVVHVPTFRRDYTRFWDNPQTACAPIFMKILAMMSIGACFVDFAETTHASRLVAAQWIHRVQAWLSTPNEKPRTNIAGLQIHCLLLIARQALGIGGDMTWLSAGTLLRTAIHMGLHRDPSHIPCMSVYQSEMRRRLWATVVELNLQGAMDSAASPLLSINDYDTASPSNIDDEQLSEDCREMPTTKPLDQYTSTSMLVLLNKTFPIRLEIATQLADFRKDLTYQGVPRLGNDLSAQCRTIHRLFRIYAKATTPPRDFHTKLIDLLTHRFLISLHSGFALQSFDNANLYYSHKVCMECAVFIAGAQTDPADKYSFYRVKLLGSGMFRDVYILCFLFISLDIMSKFEEQSYLASAAQETNRRELYGMLEENARMLRERTRVAETNVKGALKWDCVKAQIDAMEAGAEQSEIEEKILAAAKKSLTESIAVFKARLAEMNAGREGEMVVPAQIDTMMGDAWPDENAFDMLNNFNFNIPDSWLFPTGAAVDGGFWSLKA
ncbi:hypothetical protein EJ05DRAFT_498668 [Pseudovirgaria hyperparasitica]|uniref:Zn(2)-C6 fungal-type domain-containing protein n=1 Tax=Pseudovirgaria hyperparasitica TaxID=470096 RepID=A0A6A6WBN7_9PEZI|nr:uncharacterized protein EJ05DRAFT_498668 [Pseudovirgaria hyperparasitica]KAF2759454.1 hypothetical protein EJ05DRAFT_498668 [Pseudovirgaria hyperparasitica]